MIRININWFCTKRFILAVLVSFAPGVLHAGNVSYTIVDDNIYDKPIKTKIEQHIVVSGIPTKTDLEAEILKRYRAALARREFQYHNPATNIYIYLYATEEQARAGQGLWLGMIAKGYSDKGEPQVQINDERLAGLSQAEENRFGLSESQRKQVFRLIAITEDRASRDARARFPDSQIMKQIELERKLEEKYKTEIAQKNNLTKDQLLKISVEGVTKGWPTP